MCECRVEALPHHKKQCTTERHPRIKSLKSSLGLTAVTIQYNTKPWKTGFTEIKMYMCYIVDRDRPQSETAYTFSIVIHLFFTSLLRDLNKVTK